MKTLSQFKTKVGRGERGNRSQDVVYWRIKKMLKTITKIQKPTNKRKPQHQQQRRTQRTPTTGFYTEVQSQRSAGRRLPGEGPRQGPFPPSFSSQGPQAFDFIFLCMACLPAYIPVRVRLVLVETRRMLYLLGL